VNGDNDAEVNHEENSTFKNSESYNEAEAENFKNAEADLLLDMKSAQAYAYAPSAATFTHHSGREKSSGLNLLSTGGDDTHSALNLSAMAACLNQLPLSQRWIIPRHLAATLVVNGEDDEDTEEEKEEDKGFKEEDESVPSATLDTVVPVPSVDSAAVRVVAESMLGVPKPSEQRENNLREASHQDDPAHPPKVVDVSAEDRRRRNLLQRASVTSPIDLMSVDDQDDDVITRRRREMEASPRGFCPSESGTANATASIKANISTATVIDCTEEEDVDQWLETALGTESCETENVEEEGELDDWLDGVIE
jgi:hypothetical protein